MITEICRDYLRHLVNKAGGELGPCGDEVRPFIRAIGNRAVELTSLFSNSWPKAETSAGPYCLYPAADIAESERTQGLFKFGLLVIGSANGDPLVVNLTSNDVVGCEIGLVSHEQWRESASPKTECYEPICADLVELLYRAVEERYLPLDYFMAREHNRVKQRFKP